MLENGSHSELMKLGGEYHKMYTATSAPDSHKKEVACQAGDVEEEVLPAEAETKATEANLLEGQDPASQGADAAKAGADESSSIMEFGVLMQP